MLIEASKKLNEKTVFANLQDKNHKLEPHFQLGQLVRIADISQKEFLKRSFNKLEL